MKRAFRSPYGGGSVALTGPPVPLTGRSTENRNSLTNANGFANEIAKISSSLQKFVANGSLRQNSLAIENAMVWCTQSRTSIWVSA